MGFAIVESIREAPSRFVVIVSGSEERHRAVRLLSCAVSEAPSLLMAATKIRWGDTLDDDDGLDLPASTETGPDSRGFKTKVEYKKNEKGETVKVTTRTRIIKVEKKVYEVRSRRQSHCTKL